MRMGGGTLRISYGAGATRLGGYNLAEATMLVIWLGALLVLGGLVFMMAQPIWRGRSAMQRNEHLREYHVIL